MCSSYVSLHLCISLSVSLCRLSIQTVSHEPLLGPEAVLESSKARREHGHGAPKQAPCKQSDMFTSLQSLQAGTLHTDPSSPGSQSGGEKGQGCIRLMGFSVVIECKAVKYIEILHSKILCIYFEVEL